MQATTLFISLLLGLSSCTLQSNKPDKSKTAELDTAKTIIEFQPAFEEKATVTIIDIAGKKELTFFLETRIVFGEKEDTFYYLKKSLHWRKCSDRIT